MAITVALFVSESTTVVKLVAEREPELGSMDLEIQEIKLCGDFLKVGSNSFEAKNHALGRGRGPRIDRAVSFCSWFTVQRHQGEHWSAGTSLHSPWVTAATYKRQLSQSWESFLLHIWKEVLGCQSWTLRLTGRVLVCTVDYRAKTLSKAQQG